MCVELQILLKNASHISSLIEKEFAIVPIVIWSQKLSSAGVRPGLKFISPVLLCSVDCPSAPYQFHKCNFEIVEVVWLSFRKLRE